MSTFFFPLIEALDNNDDIDLDIDENTIVDDEGEQHDILALPPTRLSRCADGLFNFVFRAAEAATGAYLLYLILCPNESDLQIDSTPDTHYLGF